MDSGPKRLFATIKTEESHRYNLIDCLKISNPDGKFKILVKLEPGLNWLNFEFCRVVRHFVVNCTSKYAQVEQSHKIKLVYIIASDSDGGFQVSFLMVWSLGFLEGIISVLKKENQNCMFFFFLFFRFRMDMELKNLQSKKYHWLVP